MQALAIWLFGWLIDVLWGSILKPMLIAFAKGAGWYTLVAVIINQLVVYVDLLMQPFLMLAGNWWPALGGDFVMAASIFAIKFKITLKILQATVGQK